MRFTLSQATKRENNNFDLIRLVAALAVVFGHSFYLFPTGGYHEPVKEIIVNDYSGSLAVYTFFFLSGIFITSSYINTQTFYKFILMRVFRILPAVIICNIITVFIVGMIFTTDNLNSYFQNKETWEYLIKNTLLLKLVYLLPGVFTNNLYNTAVNGSLWTLPTEIRCYFLVFVFGVTRLLKNKIIVLIIFLLFIFYQNNTHLIHIFETSGQVKMAVFFLSGMVVYMFRDIVIINYKVAIALIIACLFSHFWMVKIFMPLFYVAFIYTILVIATLPSIKSIKLPGDYSYGIYVYGFLIQQSVAHLWPKLNTYPSMLVTLPIICFMGFLSWRLIELPAIHKGRQLSGNFNNSTFHRLDARLKSFLD